MSMKQNLGTGRRKSSVARVYLRAGEGNIVINQRTLAEYFGRESDRQIIRSPLALVGMMKKMVVLTALAKTLCVDNCVAQVS